MSTTDYFCAGRCRHITVRKFQPFGDACYGVRIRLSLNGYKIGFPHALAGMGDFENKIAIVRHQKKTFRVGVQSPDRYQSCTRNIYQINDLLLHMGVGNGRNETYRLMQSDIVSLSRSGNNLIVNGDLVGLRVHV